MIELFIQLDQASLLNQLIQAGYVTEKTRLYLDMYYRWLALSVHDYSTRYKTFLIARQFSVTERTVYNMLRWADAQYKDQSLHPPRVLKVYVQ